MSFTGDVAINKLNATSGKAETLLKKTINDFRATSPAGDVATNKTNAMSDYPKTLLKNKSYDQL